MVKLLIGDCREVLKTLPDCSINCCVTSPPYFGLRDYGVSGQIGLEQTPVAYVAEMVAVFREVRRVLRDDGTLWLNLGDSYAGSGKGPAGNLGKTNNERDMTHTRLSGHVPEGLKPKDLIGIPWRVAFALQTDGWYLRQDIIWHKPNPMPESVMDRCTKAHEYIFLLSKSARYYYNNEAVKEPLKESSIIRNQLGCNGNQDRGYPNGAQNHISKYLGSDKAKSETHRNKRSVWTVATQPYSGAHFATFPEALILPCILAGCPPAGVVLDPFGGSGTTGAVASANGRSAILIELNSKYAELVNGRCGLFLSKD